jgi:hypothetical protein
MTQTIRYDNHTWEVIKKLPDKWLLRWDNPRKPHGVSNFALRWVSLSALSSAARDSMVVIRSEEVNRCIG